MRYDQYPWLSRKGNLAVGDRFASELEEEHRGQAPNRRIPIRYHRRLSVDPWYSVVVRHVNKASAP